MEVIIRHADDSEDVFELDDTGTWRWSEKLVDPTEIGLAAKAEVDDHSATHYVLHALVKLVGSDPRGKVVS